MRILIYLWGNADNLLDFSPIFMEGIFQIEQKVSSSWCENIIHSYQHSILSIIKMSPVPLSLLGQCSVLMCLMYSILLCLSIKRRKSEFSVFGQKENNLNNSKIAGEKKKEYLCLYSPAWYFKCDLLHINSWVVIEVLQYCFHAQDSCSFLWYLLNINNHNWAQTLNPACAWV